MNRASLAVLGALALSGCATTERVTLHSNEGDNPDGAVAVLNADGSEVVLDEANSQALLGGGKTRTRSLDGPSAEHLALFGNLPPAARLFRITFPVNQARILAGERAVLDQIRAELAARPGAQIEVAGFTDSTDDEAHNDLLSRQRAEAVASELREAGFEIAPDDVVDRGEYDARAKLGDNVASEEYRRVFVIVR